MSYELAVFDHAGFRIRILQSEDSEEPDYGEDDFLLRDSGSRFTMGRDPGQADPSAHLPWNIGERWGMWSDLLKAAGVEVPPMSWNTTGDEDEQECFSTYEEWQEEYDPSYEVWPLYYGNAHGAGTGCFSIIDLDDMERRTAQFWAFVKVPATDIEKLANPDFNPNKVRDRMLRMYEQWANGDVWYYIIEKVTPCEKCGQEDVEEMDSVGDYFGADDCIAAAKEHAEGLRAQEGQKEPTV